MACQSLPKKRQISFKHAHRARSGCNFLSSADSFRPSLKTRTLIGMRGSFVIIYTLHDVGRERSFSLKKDN